MQLDSWKWEANGPIYYPGMENLESNETNSGWITLAALPKTCNRWHRRAGTRSGDAISGRTESLQRLKQSGQHRTKYLQDQYYDGALSNADNKSGIGVVQDCRGEVIASLVQQLDQAYQPMEIEAMAACKAMEFGSELGLQRVIVEGDLCWLWRP